jgi:hypothetical protein
MTGYAMEFLVKERVQERLREADRNRSARAIATVSKRGLPWHARLTLAVARLRSPVAEASKPG